VRHELFEWDDRKARANLSKHQVSFDEAVAMLADPYAGQTLVEEFDHRNSTEKEDRWKTIGTYPFDRRRVLVVSWTPRVDAFGRMVTRIINARPATRLERRRYEEETGCG
jgi:uncharacterized DUF497 family protein